MSFYGGVGMKPLVEFDVYERSRQAYKDRKFLYIFPTPHGTYNAVNYDAINNELNTFLRNFELWGSNGGTSKSCADNPKLQEIWFEVSSDFYQLLEVNSEMIKAIGRMGVQVVYEYPFCNTQVPYWMQNSTKMVDWSRESHRELISEMFGGVDF